MISVLDEIAKETNGKSFKTYKYGFEGIAVPRFDYDDHRHRITWKQYGETEYHDKPCPVNTQYLYCSGFAFFEKNFALGFRLISYYRSKVFQATLVFAKSSKDNSTPIVC